jgi:peroxiredoxin
MDFTQPNSQGQPVKLSSFKGKYVLVHFWASWDDNNSNMLELINKACQTFQAKGLTAVGVSLDADKESWLQVISEKKIENIINVSDLKGRKNEAASLYGIRKLPDNLLIDPNGIIVARNLTGFTLDKTLTSIFE